MKYTLLFCVFFLFSCSSMKKKTEQGEVLDTEIESSELSSDHQGSDSGNISGLSSVFFPYDQSKLTQKTKRDLLKNANWIKSSSKTVQIEGHCDHRGSSEYNLALGERRALAVKKYLISLGVDSNQLSVISYGEEKPLSYGDSEYDLSRNRRANFVPLP